MCDGVLTRWVLANAFIGVCLTGVHLIGVYLMGGSDQRNAGAGEVKGLGKIMGGVLASTVSYFSTLQLSDTLSCLS
jgi:hypothetical protein